MISVSLPPDLVRVFIVPEPVALPVNDLGPKRIIGKVGTQHGVYSNDLRSLISSSIISIGPSLFSLIYVTLYT